MKAQAIPFATPVLIEEYEKGYPFRNGWRVIAVATSQYNADIIIAGLSAKYSKSAFRKEISEVKAL